MTDAMSQRNALRSMLAERRRQLPAVDRVRAASRILPWLKALPAFAAGRRIAGYWTQGGELPLNIVVTTLARRSQTYCLPVIHPQRQMTFVPWQQGEPVTPNRYGIPEPVDRGAALRPGDLDVVLVPLLGFDRRGNRLGFGGGYYDTAFAFLKAGKRPAAPVLVGIGYTFQECGFIPAEPWDVPLDYVATDAGLIDCRT